MSYVMRWQLAHRMRRFMDASLHRMPVRLHKGCTGGVSGDMLRDLEGERRDRPDGNGWRFGTVLRCHTGKSGLEHVPQGTQFGHVIDGCERRPQTPLTSRGQLDPTWTTFSTPWSFFPDGRCRQQDGGRHFPRRGICAPPMHTDMPPTAAAWRARGTASRALCGWRPRRKRRSG
jgi:hypothetical protein